MNMEEYEDDFQVPTQEELSYQFAFLEIQKQLKTEWEKLKKMLPSDENIHKSVKSIDDILNYFYV